MSPDCKPAIWFPAVRATTGADVYIETLAAQLRRRGLCAEITWLPLRAEYAPWTVPVPKPPAWANVVQVNTWLHRRFIPENLPVVATVLHCVHDSAFRCYKNLAQTLYHRVHIKPMERRVLERASAIVAISQYTAERTQAAFGTTGIEVIPPAVDPAGPYHAAARTAPNKPFRLLFAGSGSRRKGVDLLVPIMERLGPNFELIVVGTSTIGTPALPPNVHIKGRLPGADDLAVAYRNADALLFPSRLEGFGLVAAEAMACGLPVIATRGSSLTEVVEDGVTGTLCPQDDVDAFASAARQLAADTRLAEAMSHAAQLRVADIFSVERMLDAYVRLYARCVHSVRTGRVPQAVRIGGNP